MSQTILDADVKNRTQAMPCGRITTVGCRRAVPKIPPMTTQELVLQLLDDTLSLHGRSATFNRDTPLIGAIPELDSMAVVSLINGIEDSFGVTVDDDDIDGSTFATVGSLVDYVQGKLGA